jgi:hypothetical protein
MSKVLGATALIIGLGIGLAGNANATHADKGLDWSLTYSGAALPDSDPTSASYLIKLGLDTDGYHGKASFLDQLALKTITPFADISLVSAPSGLDAWGSPGGLSGWGCHAGGFACADSLQSLNGGKGLSLSSSNGVGIDDYSWVFRVTVKDGKPLDKPGADAIFLTRLVDDNGFKAGPLGAGPLSLTVSAVPEPGAYAMMLAGLGMIGAVTRRKAKDKM